MSRASDLEAARLAKERTDARGAAIEQLIEPADNSWPVPANVLNGLAEQMLAEATYIAEQRKSGWKSRSDAHTAAARILEQWARDLAAYLERDKPPTRPPLETIKSPDKHAGLDSADGPISAQITSGLMSQATADRLIEQATRLESDAQKLIDSGASVTDLVQVVRPDGSSAVELAGGHVTADVARAIREAKDVDAKLDVAFGPDKPAPVHIAAAPANYAWCDATTGLRGYVGSATCPDCIARYDAYDEAANKSTAGAMVGIPQFSEPGPAPVRQTQQRMTFDAVREHGMARARGADHRSYSQVNAFAECGVRYALSDLETPAWWNVGGTALHYACEHINRQCHDYDIEVPGTDRVGPVPTDHAIETLWTNCLNRATSEAIAEHPTVGPDRWRAAKKGAEGYDWWRVNGVDMVRRWVTRLTWLYEQGWRIAEFNGTPAIEYDCPMWILTGIDTPNDIKVENIIDLVLTRDDGTLLIVDAKSGASAPDSTAQLGQYAWALNNAITTAPPIIGAYWLARTDALDIGATDLRELHPWSEIEYLITTMHAAEQAGLYLPNRTRWCVSCGVNGLCPVGPR